MRVRPKRNPEGKAKEARVIDSSQLRRTPSPHTPWQKPCPHFVDWRMQSVLSFFLLMWSRISITTVRFASRSSSSSASQREVIVCMCAPRLIPLSLLFDPEGKCSLLALLLEKPVDAAERMDWTLSNASFNRGRSVAAQPAMMPAVMQCQ